MPVSYLTNSVAEMLASALNTLTGGSFSHLTMSEDEMLARIVTEMTGQEYSHLTTSRETLWELLLTQAASDGITFDRLTQSNEQIAEIIANNVSAGGGEDPYTTGAVTFDGSSWLGLASLTAANSPLHSFSAWVKTTDIPASAVMIFIVAPQELAPQVQNGVMPGGEVDIDLGRDDDHFVAFSFVNVNDGAWHHILGSFDMNAESGSRIAAIYVDDALVIKPPSFDTGGPFSMLFSGKEVAVGSDTAGGNYLGDMADVWVAPGQSLLVDDEIPEVTRRKFIDADGKPVDLGADGSTPTGTAPSVFLRRAPAAAASTFANNLGTGGTPFTITGTLTNAGTSPSDEVALGTWPPEDAVVALDFENNRYFDGTGASTAAALLQNDSNEWGATLELDSISFDGLVMTHQDGFSPAAEFMTAVLAGCTIVVDFAIGAGANADGDAKLSFDILTLDFSVFPGFGTQTAASSLGTSAGAVGDPLPGFEIGRNKFALTASASNLAASVNGSAVEAFTPEWGVVEWAAFRWVSLQTSCTIHSITVYEPLADAALPALTALD